MNATSTRNVKVEGGGEQVVAHVGLHALGSFADRLGLADWLSGAIPITSERLPLHDRGKVLAQTFRSPVGRSMTVVGSDVAVVPLESVEPAVGLAVVVVDGDRSFRATS